MLVLAALMVMATADPAPVPAPTCAKPALIKRPGITPDEANRVAAQAQAYIDCMKPYIDEHRVKTDTLMGEAKLEADAANGGIKSVNEFVAAFNGWRDSLQPGGN